MQRRHNDRISFFTKLCERPNLNDKQLRAIVRIGQSVNFAVERFASVGEAIANDNPEIRNEMYDACKDARTAGALIEQLCSLTAPSLRGKSIKNSQQSSLVEDVRSKGIVYDQSDSMVTPVVIPSLLPSTTEEAARTNADRSAMYRAARALLASVTRVLLVADTVVVKQIVASQDRVAMFLNRLENIANFTEFVKAFSHFGIEMVELTNLTNSRQKDMKNERRRAQMDAAKKTLERSTMMLLTTSKVCLRHPDCQNARENRDTVFAQMRRTMDLIHFVVKEGIHKYHPNQSLNSSTITKASTIVGEASQTTHPFHRPQSSSSTNTTTSSSFHLSPFDPHNEALLFGYDYEQIIVKQKQQQQQSKQKRQETTRTRKFEIPKYQRRGQLHRVQSSIPDNSFVLAVESTLRWLHEQLNTCPTIVNFLRRINELSDLIELGQSNSHIKEQILYAFDALQERTQDFTDSAYTNHEHRENILLLCEQLRAEIEAMFNIVASSNDRSCFTTTQTTTIEELDTFILQISSLTYELRCKLQDIALDQADELFRNQSSIDLPLLLKESAIICDHERIDDLIEQFREHSDHVQEVCRLLFHIAPTTTLQVTAGHTETSIEIHGEQLLTALRTLLFFPKSKIVKENFQVFAEVWSTLIGDILQLLRDINEYCRESNHQQQQRSSPSQFQIATVPIASSLSSSMLQPTMISQPLSSSPSATALLSMGIQTNRTIPPSPPLALAPVPYVYPYDTYVDKRKDPILLMGDTAADSYLSTATMPFNQTPTISQSINEIPPVPPPPLPPPPLPGGAGRTGNVQINPEVEVYEIEKSTAPPVDLDDNDIVRKAKAMSSMAMSMFQFTRGEGELKTTQDLFTQAEFFAEEANKLYKIVRHFTYQIPTGSPKKELLDSIDKVPTYVQQLQFAVKNVTVGKTATFTKVDNVIQETKNLMSVITNVVSASLNCATKHNLDMQGALRTRARTLSPSYRTETEMFFEGGAMSKTGVASSDPDI